MILSLGTADHDRDGKAEILVPQSWVYEIDPADAADVESDGMADVVDNCLSVANPTQADTDLDGVGNACDNCQFHANPDQGPAPFGHEVRAASTTTFSWPTPARVKYVRGPLTLVGSYTTDLVGTLANASSFTDTTAPVPASGFYYVFRPDCSVGSWQTTIGAEPARDTSLP